MHISKGTRSELADLARKLRRYINAYSASAQPIRWKYSYVPGRGRHRQDVGGPSAVE